VPDPIAEHDRTRAGLGAQLRALRRRAGLTGGELAAQAGISQSKVSKIETGRMTASVEDVERLTRLLPATPEEAAALLDLARRLSTELRTWRAMRRQNLAGHQQRAHELEAAARSIRVFQPTVVPGLLQTAEYARQVFLRGRLADDAASLTAAVMARLDRQTALFDPSKEFVFLLTEAALRTRIAPEPILKVQVDRIVTLASLPNVTIAYLPLSAELDVLPVNEFTMYDDQAVAVETVSAELILRDDRDIALYTDTFEHLLAAALVGPPALGALRLLYDVPNTEPMAERGQSRTVTA
jgi:transcriptional regulator with XRE-family HTH domain